MKFSERLITAREHAKISQEQLAHEVGVSQGAISKIERGEADGSKYVVKIAMVCGVRPEWLSEDDGCMLDTRIYAKNEQDAAALMLMQEIPVYAKSEAIKSLVTVKKLSTGAGESPPESAQK